MERAPIGLRGARVEDAAAIAQLNNGRGAVSHER